jgi:hypothetical protein
LTKGGSREERLLGSVFETEGEFKEKKKKNGGRGRGRIWWQ